MNKTGKFLTIIVISGIFCITSIVPLHAEVAKFERRIKENDTSHETYSPAEYKSWCDWYEVPAHEQPLFERDVPDPVNNPLSPVSGPGGPVLGPKIVFNKVNSSPSLSGSSLGSSGADRMSAEEDTLLENLALRELRELEIAIEGQVYGDGAREVPMLPTGASTSGTQGGSNKRSGKYIPNDEKHDNDNYGWHLAESQSNVYDYYFPSIEEKDRKVIGLASTGINCDHADLIANIAINQAEVDGLNMQFNLDADGDGYVSAVEFKDASGKGTMHEAIIYWNSKDQSSGYDDDGNGLFDDYAGWNFIDNNAFACSDSFGAGTAAASIAAATNDNTIGTAGPAGNLAQIRPLKVCTNDGLEYCDSDAIAAAVAAAAMADAGADILVLPDKAIDSTIGNALEYYMYPVQAKANFPKTGRNAIFSSVTEYSGGDSISDIYKTVGVGQYKMDGDTMVSLTLSEKGPAFVVPGGTYYVADPSGDGFHWIDYDDYPYMTAYVASAFAAATGIMVRYEMQEWLGTEQKFNAVFVGGLLDYLQRWSSDRLPSTYTDFNNYFVYSLMWGDDTLNFGNALEVADQYCLNSQSGGNSMQIEHALHTVIYETMHDGKWVRILFDFLLGAPPDQNIPNYVIAYNDEHYPYTTNLYLDSGLPLWDSYHLEQGTKYFESYIQESKWIHIYGTIENFYPGTGPYNETWLPDWLEVGINLNSTDNHWGASVTPSWNELSKYNNRLTNIWYEY